MKYIYYISIIFAVAFGLYGVITGDLKLQPIMYFVFGIAYLTLVYRSYKKGEKRNAIFFTIPFLIGTSALIVLLYRLF